MSRILFDGKYYKAKAEGHPAVSHLPIKHQYVQVSRLTMEKMLGRHLKSSEFVLHKDGDTTNDDPSNLILGDSKSQNQVHGRVYSYILKGGDTSVFINKKYRKKGGDKK